MKFLNRLKNRVAKLTKLTNLTNLTNLTKLTKLTTLHWKASDFGSSSQLRADSQSSQGNPDQATKKRAEFRVKLPRVVEEETQTTTCVRR